MRRSELADLAAMGLSLACMLHCLAVPLLLVAAPWIVPAFFGDEAFHVVAVTLVMPVSLIALAGSAALRPGLVALAVVGVGFLLSAIFAPSEVLERGLSVIGASVLAGVHLANLRWRRTLRPAPALEAAP